MYELIQDLPYCTGALSFGLSKRTQKIGFQDQLSLIAGQKYCSTAILSTFIKLSFSIKAFVLYIFEWPLKTCFTEVSSAFR